VARSRSRPSCTTAHTGGSQCTAPRLQAPTLYINPTVPETGQLHAEFGAGRVPEQAIIVQNRRCSTARGVAAQQTRPLHLTPRCVTSKHRQGCRQHFLHYLQELHRKAQSLGLARLRRTQEGTLARLGRGEHSRKRACAPPPPLYRHSLPVGDARINGKAVELVEAQGQHGDACGAPCATANHALVCGWLKGQVQGESHGRIHALRATEDRAGVGWVHTHIMHCSSHGRQVWGGCMHHAMNTAGRCEEGACTVPVVEGKHTMQAMASCPCSPSSYPPAGDKRGGYAVRKAGHGYQPMVLRTCPGRLYSSSDSEQQARLGARMPAAPVKAADLEATTDLEVTTDMECSAALLMCPSRARCTSLT